MDKIKTNSNKLFTRYVKNHVFNITYLRLKIVLQIFSTKLDLNYQRIRKFFSFTKVFNFLSFCGFKEPQKKNAKRSLISSNKVCENITFNIDSFLFNLQNEKV
jgi:hypothetical protein